MKPTESTVTHNNPGFVRAVVNVSDGAYQAQKQVNIQIMRKIGQLVIALRPEELLVQGKNIYRKVPLCVVNLIRYLSSRTKLFSYLPVQTS